MANTTVLVASSLHTRTADFRVAYQSHSGPYGLKIFDPHSWEINTSEGGITLEFTRVVIAIGVFAIGVELPKKYIYRHWKSLFFLLVPVTTWVQSAPYILPVRN
jgi:NhaP-type Na+/H+ or K+/H+ antiporter